jgi:hypothetical protein
MNRALEAPLGPRERMNRSFEAVRRGFGADEPLGLTARVYGHADHPLSNAAAAAEPARLIRVRGAGAAAEERMVRIPPRRAPRDQRELGYHGGAEAVMEVRGYRA